MQEMVDDEKKNQACDFLTSEHIDIAGRPTPPPTVYVMSLWKSDKQPGLSSGLPSSRIIYVPRYLGMSQLSSTEGWAAGPNIKDWSSTSYLPSRW